jgi:FkbM family methyltransferase
MPRARYAQLPLGGMERNQLSYFLSFFYGAALTLVLLYAFVPSPFPPPSSLPSPVEALYTPPASAVSQPNSLAAAAAVAPIAAPCVACPSCPATPPPLAAPAADPFCEALTVPFDEPVVKIKHVGHGSFPSFWICTPSDAKYLKGWGAKWLPGPIDTGMRYEAFASYFADAPRDAVFLDVGGHVGVPALAAAAAGFRVISFEPTPSNLRNYKRAVCFNGFQDRMQLVEAAVSDFDGTTEIFVPVTDQGEQGDNSAIAAGAATANVGGTSKGTTVGVLKLDTWVAAHLSDAEVASVRLLKVDVQGTEARVVRGAAALLRRLHKDAWVVMEHSGNLMAHSGVGATEDVDEMQKLGFDTFDSFRGNPISAESALGLEDIWYRRRAGV